LIIAIAGGLLLSCDRKEVGRYQFHDSSNALLVIDTVTGKVWKYEEEGRFWIPVRSPAEQDELLQKAREKKEQK